MKLFKLIARNIAIATGILLATWASETYIGYPAGGLVFASFGIACLFAYMETL